MQVHVFNHWSDAEQTFEGKNEAVLCHKLEEAFPWLESGDSEHHGDLEALLEHLNSSGGYEAEVVSDGLAKAEDYSTAGPFDVPGPSTLPSDMAGFNPLASRPFRAVQFLTGRPEVSHQVARRAVAHQGSLVDAALAAYGMELTDEHRRAVMGATHLVDFGQYTKTDIPEGEEVKALSPDSEQTAEGVRDAFSNGEVKPATVDGKHSKGSLIARDTQNDSVYFLKPGSGGTSPAVGVDQEDASPSNREAAFWRIADNWGLGNSVPRADIISIDGKEYAAIHMLPFTWSGIEKKAKGDYSVARQVFEPYRNRGTLHKWAVMDWALGNADRHADNILVPDNNKMAALIDHGSAFAGDAFHPGHDRNSFIPYYLRAWSGSDFDKLSAEQKLKVMPQAPVGVRAELHSWLEGISPEHLAAVCKSFGIDPGPSLRRLERLKKLANAMPVDQAVNRVWIM